VAGRVDQGPVPQSGRQGGRQRYLGPAADAAGILYVTTCLLFLRRQVVRTGVSLTAGRKVLRLVVDGPAGLVWSAGTFDTLAVGP
jgi:hypothetical protein